MNTDELSEMILEVKRRSGAGGMSVFEYSAVAKAILDEAPCRLLVFGAGYDSDLWIRCNIEGETVFVEDSEHWVELLRSTHPDAVVEQVDYVRRDDPIADENGTIWDVKPLAVSQTTLRCEWNIIVVDAPKGHTKDAPGRSQSIYMASVLRNKNTTIFVHDINRSAEWDYCSRWLGTPPRITPRLSRYGQREWYTRSFFFITHTIRRELKKLISRGFAVFH